MAMAMDGELCAGEEHVDKPLSLGVKAVVEVIVHAQAGGCLSLLSDFIEKFVVDDHDSDVPVTHVFSLLALVTTLNIVIKNILRSKIRLIFCAYHTFNSIR